MAIVVDQTSIGTPIAIDAGATTVALTTNVAVAAGATIILGVSGWTNSTLLSVANTGSSVLSWIIDKQGKHSGNQPFNAIVSAHAPSGLSSGAVITATYSTTVNGRLIGGTSFTGVEPESVDGVPVGPTSTTGTAWTTASVATEDGSLVVGLCSLEIHDTSTVTAPSIEALDWGDGADNRTTMCYRVEGTGASYTVAGTWGGSRLSVTNGVAYLVSAAAVDNTTKPATAGMFDPQLEDKVWF